MKPARYLATLINTLTSPKYYLEVLNLPLTFSWRFFLVSYLFLTVIATGLFVAYDLPYWRHAVQQIAQDVEQYYPADLKITWDTHTLATEPNKILTVAYPNVLPKNNFPDQLAVIDTSVSNAKEAIPSTMAQPLSVITKDHFYVSDLAGDWSGTNLSDIPGFDQPFAITAQNWPEYVTQARQQLDFLLNWSPAIFPLVFYIFSSLATILSAFFDSILLYLFLRLFRRPFPYRKVFQLTLHVSIVAEFVQLCTQRFLSTTQLNMYTITFWAYMIVILFSLRGVRQIFFVKKV